MDQSLISDGPRVVGAEVVEKEMGELCGKVVEKARELSAAVKDDASREIAVKYGSDLAGKVKFIKAARVMRYEPLKKACDSVREFFDDPLKRIKIAMDTLSAGVTAYDIEIKRKERIAQEALEAEARRRQEEYERKKREYEANVARQKAEDDRRERERLASLEAERRAKIKAEEDARLAHAEEAKAQGNEGKVDAILAQATPIAAPAPAAEPEKPRPILPPSPPPPAPAPAAIIAKRPDPAVVAVVRWPWDLTDIKALARAVAESRAPAEYLTANRAPITTDVTRLKNGFACDGLRAYPQSKTSFRTVEE